jgi:hypothetical protein
VQAARFSAKAKAKKEEDVYFTWTFMFGGIAAVGLLPAGFVMSCKTDEEFYESMKNEYPDVVNFIEDNIITMAPDPPGNVGVIVRAEHIPYELGEGQDLAIVQLASQEVYHVRVTPEMSMSDVLAVCVEQGAKPTDSVYDVLLDPDPKMFEYCPPTRKSGEAAPVKSSSSAASAPRNTVLPVALPTPAAPAPTTSTMTTSNSSASSGKSPAEQLNALRLQEVQLKRELAVGSDRSVDSVEMELLSIVEQKREVKRTARHAQR